MSVSVRRLTAARARPCFDPLIRSPVSRDSRAAASGSFLDWKGLRVVVVETTNRHLGWNFPRRLGPTPNMRVIERYTRVDHATLLYEYTVDAPETYTGPWSTA